MRYAVSREAARAVVNKGMWPIASIKDVHQAVTGHMTDALRDAIRRDLLVAGTQAKVDSVSAALLTHLGINPAVLFAICIHATDAEVNDADGFQVVSLGSDGYCHLRFDGPDGPDWRTMGGHLGKLPRIPRTVAMAARGRPLREVVSHPALDPLDLVAGEIDDIFDHSYVIVDRFGWMEGEALARMVGGEKTCG